MHTVGSSKHKEYWIPAEELAEFNDSIVRSIELITEFYSPPSGREPGIGPDAGALPPIE